MKAAESESRELKICPSGSPPASPIQPASPMQPTKLPAISPDKRSSAKEMVIEKKLRELVELQRIRVAQRNSAQEAAAAAAVEELRNQRRQRAQHQASCICGRTGKLVTHQDVRPAQQKVAKAKPTRVSTAVAEEWQDSVL